MEKTDHVRQSLEALPALRPPRELRDRLRIIASRESSRQRRRTTLEAWWTHFREDLTLTINNLIRPFAVPAAGGLASAVVLFGVLGSSPLVTTYQNQVMHGDPTDVPTGLTSQATLQYSYSYNLSDATMIIDVVVDQDGRVMDYSIPRGQEWASDPSLVRNVENMLLCTKFNPARWFGKPASGRARIKLEPSWAVDVRPQG